MRATLQTELLVRLMNTSPEPFAAGKELLGYALAAILATEMEH